MTPGLAGNLAEDASATKLGARGPWDRPVDRPVDRSVDRCIFHRFSPVDRFFKNLKYLIF